MQQVFIFFWNQTNGWFKECADECGFVSWKRPILLHYYSRHFKGWQANIFILWYYVFKVKWGISVYTTYYQG